MPEITEKAENTDNLTEEQLRETVFEQAGQLERLSESFTRLEWAMEDRGWSRASANEYTADGLSLTSIQSISELLMEHQLADSLIKRITELRGTYIYGDGIQFNKLGGAQKAFDDPKNQKVLFSSEGLLALNRAHCASGNFIVLWTTATKKLQRIPLAQITAWNVNPDDDEEIWHIRREWTRYAGTTNEKKAVEWYATDTAPPAERNKLPKTKDGKASTVTNGKIAVIDSVNMQAGWTWGIPDLLGSLQWSIKYGNYLKSQDKFATALSQIAVQFKAKSAKGASSAQSIVRNAGNAGNAVTGADFDMVPQTGASGVVFSNGLPMAAMAAAAGEVSVLAALSNPGAVSGSNAAAQTLDPPQYKMVSARRKQVTNFLTRVLVLMGGPKATVTWPQLEDDAIFRQNTSLAAAWGTGLFEPEEIRPRMAELNGLKITGTAPDGVMIPNNTNFPGTLSNDSQPASTQKPSGANSQANGQGQDNLGVGKTTAGTNDARDNGDFDQ